MTPEQGKQASAERALDFVQDGSIVGVGTGSTVAYFIQGLGRIKHRIEGAVSSSEQSTKLLKALGIPVFASGGVHSRDDVVRLRAVAGNGIAGVIVGRALYDGAVKLSDLVSAAK